MKQKIVRADVDSLPGIWHESVKLTIELLKSRRHAVQHEIGLLNSGALNRGQVLCVTVAVNNGREKLVDEFHEQLQRSAENTETKALRRISLSQRILVGSLE